MPRAKAASNPAENGPNTQLYRFLQRMAQNYKFSDIPLSNSFQKVAAAVAKIISPITSPLELKHLKGMVPSAFILIEAFFDGLNDGLQAQATESIAVSETLSAEPLSQKQANRPYIPKHKSGSWAILVAMLDAEISNGGPLTLTKKQIIDRATPLSTASFTRMNSQSSLYITAWNSMKTLERNSLCQRLDKPCRFQLTAEGRKMAQYLIDADPTRRFDLRSATDCITTGQY